MIAVSQAFKNAIKNPNRNIKGYVEIKYDVSSASGTPTIDATSTTTPISDILTGTSVKDNYGTLDYLKLDGSQLTLDTTISNNTNGGYITDALADSEIDLTITLSTATSLKGITLYFKNNGIKSLSYRLNSTGSYTSIEYDEGKDQALIIFSEETSVTTIEVKLLEFEYEDRKLKLSKVDLGISTTYKDQDLISFTVDEGVNKLVEETPINECDITLNNLNEIFNPLNPSGIVNYLTDNSLITPYAGVLVDGEGIKYVKMGEFYFKDYTNNSDGTTNLTGQNYMSQLESKTLEYGLYEADAFFIDGVSSTTNNTTAGILANSGINANINIYIDQPTNTKNPYMLRSFDFIDALTFLKKVAIHNFGIFYVDRNNVVQMRNPKVNIVDSLTKSELIEDANFKKTDRINTVKRYSDYSPLGKSAYQAPTQDITTIDETVTLTKTTQVFAVPKRYSNWFEPDGTYCTLTRTGGTGATVGGEIGNSAYAFIQVTGSVGEEVTLLGEYHNVNLETTTNHYEHTKTNKQDGEKVVTLEINDISSNYGYQHGSSLGQLEYTPSYEMSFEYNGDPSLEAGDYINVETPYGYKKLFIQSHRITYDGGLTGSIEGVE